MISISISLCGWMTPLNYDLYLYQFVCGWMTPLLSISLSNSFKL